MPEDTTEETRLIELGKPTPEKKKDSSSTKVLAIVLVIVAFCVVAYQVYMNTYNLPFDPGIVRHDGNQLYVAAFGQVGDDAIQIVKSNIERQYPELGTAKVIELEIPPSARKDMGPGTIAPLSADALLVSMAQKGKELPDLLKMMAVTEEPLYFEEAGPERDIWGLTDAVGGNYGVVSTTLKRKEIEDEGHARGTKEYDYYFDLSLGKSSLHEFGHLMGLNHCKGNVGCPLELATSMSVLEKKGNTLCRRHREQLRKLYTLWVIQPVKENP